MKKSIRCVPQLCISHETGKSGKKYRKKENYRVSIDEDVDSERLDETVR